MLRLFPHSSASSSFRFLTGTPRPVVRSAIVNTYTQHKNTASTRLHNVPRFSRNDTFDMTTSRDSRHGVSPMSWQNEREAKQIVSVPSAQMRTRLIMCYNAVPATSWEGPLEVNIRGVVRYVST